ncbi:hypothetical protein HN803_03240 [candidate division WWE3 bacterium]|jgi:hypothetical protein|nr:hypothetical protein [Candidatus Scalindua sp.]MBT7349787.1 hypothetical protein [candidate division WWE3 bacterium]
MAKKENNIDKEYYGPYIVVQEITNRHSKRCNLCGEKPKDIRILVKSEDIFEHGKVDCYCLHHGIQFLHLQIDSLKSILGQIEEKEPIPLEVKEDTFCDFIKFRPTETKTI